MKMKIIFYILFVAITCQLNAQTNIKRDSTFIENKESSINEKDLEVFMSLAIGHYTLGGVFLIERNAFKESSMVMGEIENTENLLENFVQSKGGIGHQFLKSDTIDDNCGDYIMHNLSPEKILVITRDFDNYVIKTYVLEVK